MIDIPMYNVRKCETVRELLDSSADLWPNETALFDGQRSICYAELLVLLRSNARRLCKIVTGSSIMLLSRERRLSLKTALSILSAMYAGIRVIYLNTAANKEWIDQVMVDYGCDWLWTDCKNLAAMYLHTLPLGELPNEWPEDKLRTVCGNTDCSVLFTSGTTDTPKSVVITNHGLCADAWGATQLFPVKPGIRALSCLPYYHGYAILADLICPMLNGACLLTATNAGMVNDMLFYRPTHISGVPVMAKMVLQLYASGMLRADGGSLKTFLCSGATMDSALVDQLGHYGVMLFNSYGMTECSTAVAINPLTQNKPESVGVILPCCEASISPRGELLLRGENMMKGYGPEGHWPNPDEWFPTGDLARLDGEGFLYILGRVDNMINLPNGEKVNPEQLERLLLNTGAIKEAMVYRPNSANFLAARIVASLNQAAAQWAVDIVNDIQPPDVRIEKVHLCDSLERNHLGKIIRRNYDD